jgi:hypothetical protein
MHAAAAARRYPELIKARAPIGLLAAVQAAAARRHTTSSEWMRRALLERLEAEGIRLRDGNVEALDDTAGSA